LPEYINLNETSSHLQDKIIELFFIEDDR